jgi:hypothetical protein
MHDWDKLRRNKYSPNRPDDWPGGVRAISMEGLTLLGVHEESGKLYWDGKEVVIRSRFALATFERVIAGSGLAIALGGLVVDIGRAAGWWH